MIPCPSCGRLNRPGARYCASCQATLDAAAGPLQPGQTLGDGAYRVVRPLGKGGMGAVWLVAQTRAFDRLAVLKEVIEYFDQTDPDARQKAVDRFEAEARTLAELKHPGVPDLYAFFSEAGHNYLVMEYVEGQDLSQGLTRDDPETGQLLPGGPVPVDQALRYMTQICEVLEYLAGCHPPVVHNDIKPGNIIVDCHSGRAVLVDFGTAKTRYLRATGHPDSKKASVYGTVGYAAPELYQGRSEPRSDVYSLAATAYHLLTDDDPRGHPGQYPRLGALPSGLADLLRAGLAPEVDDRPTAQQFGLRLQRYASGQLTPIQALTFPDGDTASGREEMLAQALRHWGYSAGLLEDGTLVRWLRGTLRDVAAAQAAEAALAQCPGNAGAALDMFLRQIAPGRMPPGAMELRTDSIRLSVAGQRQPIQQTIELVNRGQGYLRGRAFSTQPWLKVESVFGCPPGEAGSVRLEIDPGGLAAGQSYVAAVTLTPVAGAPEVVPVQIMVARQGN